MKFLERKTLTILHAAVKGDLDNAVTGKILKYMRELNVIREVLLPILNELISELK